MVEFPGQSDEADHVVDQSEGEGIYILVIDDAQKKFKAAKASKVVQKVDKAAAIARVLARQAVDDHVPIVLRVVDQVVQLRFSSVHVTFILVTRSARWVILVLLVGEVSIAHLLIHLKELSVKVCLRVEDDAHRLHERLIDLASL